MDSTGGFDTRLVKLYCEDIEVDQTRFDPRNVGRYHGCVITTRHDSKSYSTYSITKDGRISGRPSIEDAKIEMIGGVDPEIYKQLYHDLAWCCRPPKMISSGELRALITNLGQNLRRGLMLVLTITPEYAKKMDRNGMITSPIEDIEFIQ